MRKCQCVCMFISYGYMCMNIYFIWTFKYIVDMFNFYMTCVLMRMHTYLRTHACTVFNVGKRVCDGCRFYSFIFLTTYVNHHICLPERLIYTDGDVPYLPMGVWFVFQRHGLTLRRFILLFIDTVCFTCMYFVSNDDIKTEVNYKKCHARTVVVLVSVVVGGRVWVLVCVNVWVRLL